jgi:hypothetical protein
LSSERSDHRERSEWVQIPASASPRTPNGERPLCVSLALVTFR